MKAFLLCGALAWCLQVLAAEIPLRNAGFESGLSDWTVWAREAPTMASRVDTQSMRTGRAALRIDHQGQEDWSLQPGLRLTVLRLVPCALRTGSDPDSAVGRRKA